VAPGKQVAAHSFWLFPIVVDDPERVKALLRGRGFDVTRGQTSLCVVDPPPEGKHADEAKRAMDNILYLPVYPQMSQPKLDHLVRSLGDATRRAKRPTGR